MKYLCLVYLDESKRDIRSGSDNLSFQKELQHGGYHIASAALEPVQSAATLCMRNGEVCISDGPFFESNEPLTEFYVIDARDLNDAVRVAAKIPSARQGYIEVRSIKDDSYG